MDLGDLSLGSPTKKARGAGGEEKRPKNKPTRAERKRWRPDRGGGGPPSSSARGQRPHTVDTSVPPPLWTKQAQLPPRPPRSPQSLGPLPGQGAPGMPGAGTRAEGVRQPPASVPRGPGRPGRKGGARRRDQEPVWLRAGLHGQGQAGPQTPAPAPHRHRGSSERPSHSAMPGTRAEPRGRASCPKGPMGDSTWAPRPCFPDPRGPMAPGRGRPPCPQFPSTTRAPHLLTARAP